MKKFFYLLSSAAIALFFQTMAFSQISITTGDLTNNYFGAGKSWFLYESPDTVMMNVGSASSSAAQTWSAPSLNIKDSLRLDNVLPSSTPYNADFPGAMYAQKGSILDSIITLETYAYYRLSNDSLLTLGSAQHEAGSFGGMTFDTSIINNRAQLALRLPLQLGEVIAQGADTINSSGLFFEVTTETETYDAYGTLNLPIGSFGALRETNVILTKVYNGATLVNSSTSYTISWVTESGNQLAVQVDTLPSGNVKVHSVSLTYVGSTPATLVKASAQLPGSFMLSQNYPNPFNPTTNIQFTVPADGRAVLKVFNTLGQEVATLFDGEATTGTYHQVQFNASNLASGIYFSRLEFDGKMQMKKMVLLK